VLVNDWNRKNALKFSRRLEQKKGIIVRYYNSFSEHRERGEKGEIELN